MKYNSLIISLGLAATMGLASCNGDLNLQPSNPNSLTSSQFESDPKGYLDKSLAECYAAFATTGTGGASGNANIQGFDGGSGTFQRAIYNLNEIPTDEACWLSVADNYLSGSLQYSIFPADNSAIYGTYSRLTININLINEFIRNVQGGAFGNDATIVALGEKYVNQVRVLRGLCYFYLLDMFGDVPYATEENASGSTPEQKPRAEIYDLVVADLEACSAKFDDSTPAYGYVGKDACDALLAKFYINSEVFAGKNDAEKCWNKCKEIIARHKGTGFQGSGLAEHYTSLFAANNDEQFGREILWLIPVSSTYLTSFANTTLLVKGWLTDSGTDSEYTLKQSDYGVAGGWKCMLARPEFVKKFEWNADYSVSPDKRTSLWKTSADGFKLENTELNQDAFGNGYLPMKFVNLNCDASGNLVPGSQISTDQCDGDYPVIRLAEIYLTAVEAFLRGAGNATEALEYANYVRERAGVAPWNDSQLSKNNILDERCRELYQENCRRTDLVRFGKYAAGEDEYIWSWKGQSAEGVSIPATSNLYPLPSTIVSLAGYKQNPGY